MWGFVAGHAPEVCADGPIHVYGRHVGDASRQEEIGSAGKRFYLGWTVLRLIYVIRNIETGNNRNRDIFFEREYFNGNVNIRNSPNWAFLLSIKLAILATVKIAIFFQNISVLQINWKQNCTLNFFFPGYSYIDFDISRKRPSPKMYCAVFDFPVFYKISIHNIRIIISTSTGKTMPAITAILLCNGLLKSKCKRSSIQIFCSARYTSNI